MTSSKRLENICIWVGWALIFALPALYLFFESLVDDTKFDIIELYNTWKQRWPYIPIFAIHHYLLIKLFYKHKYIQYTACVLSLMTLFSWFQIENHKAMQEHFRKEHHTPVFPEESLEKPIHELPPFPQPHHHEDLKPRHQLLRAPLMSRIIIALLIMGMDLGVCSLINSRRSRNRLLVLEKEKLAVELNYLKYQINPHFFMNTLNNIHALIDIDKEQAQRTIVNLSHLMRYVLYESSEKFVPLGKEMEFIRLYISLMELRYSNTIEIKMDVQENTDGINIPPLILICFVENAFKHGISNSHNSFISIDVHTDHSGKLLNFKCRNSYYDFKSIDELHGIGIENARKRLDLIYGSRYSLTIKEEKDRKTDEEKRINTFEIWLQIPTTSPAI